jgi:hypothetical protein
LASAGEDARPTVSLALRGPIITSNGGRVPIQAACHNQPAYEANALLKLHALTQLDAAHTDRIDFVLVVCVNKRHKDAVERALKRQNSGNLPGRLVLLDFDLVLDPQYDWAPVFEMPL